MQHITNISHYFFSTRGCYLTEFPTETDELSFYLLPLDSVRRLIMPRDEQASVLNLIPSFCLMVPVMILLDVCVSLCLNIRSFDAPLQLCIYKVVTLVDLTDAGQIDLPIILKKAFF